jgi:NAD(P)-dependent dehydrogenase (short-subunit alcohol dehydrogenase family)
MLQSSTGNVAVVTGATGGIGKEIARGLAQAGTVVVGARSIERGEAAAAEIAASSSGAAPAPFEMLTWGLPARTAGSGVTANCAEPGFVRTDLNRHAKESARP